MRITLNMAVSSEALKSQALELGFNLVGIVVAEPSPTFDAYLRWIGNGMHADMGYMARPDRIVRRQDLQVILPGVRSMVVVGVDYRAEVPESLLTDPARGRFAAYAWHLDYHEWLLPRLEALAAMLGGQPSCAYVDTGALLERSHGWQAGLGFIGKNTLLIHPQRGSYFFLGELLTTLEFDTYDTPTRPTMCGNCTRCLTACPTDAFPAPHVLDSRRCISYHTIENKGHIPHELRPLFGNWVYGCDVCQEVCPWQRFSTLTGVEAFRPTQPERIAPTLLDLLQLTDEAFATRYAHSAIARVKRARLVRNACIAAGNWRDESALTHLQRLLEDEHAIVRAAAAWGMLQIGGSRLQVEAAYQREPDTLTRADIATSLAEHR